MEIDYAIFQNPESFGEEMFFKTVMRKFGILFGEF